MLEKVGIKSHFQGWFWPLLATEGAVEATTWVQKLLHSAARCLFIHWVGSNTKAPVPQKNGIFSQFLTDFVTWVSHLQHLFPGATVQFLAQTVCDCMYLILIDSIHQNFSRIHFTTTEVCVFTILHACCLLLAACCLLLLFARKGDPTRDLREG